jgi:hypothetical protein
VYEGGGRGGSEGESGGGRKDATEVEMVRAEGGFEEGSGGEMGDWNIRPKRCPSVVDNWQLVSVTILRC